ncbi:MAG: hypothetical protein IJC37_01700 [Clostridia bacterium]|nr:hypothetical protein [Clostridia bacterium]
MKLIRNKKSFVLGMLTIFVSLFQFAICIWADKPNILFVAFLLAVSGTISLINAISPRFLGEKQYESFEDERDVYIASKCTTIASRAMFLGVVLAMIVFGILFMIFENTLFLWVFVSLASCLLLFSVVYLIVNIYYEKRM